MAKYIITQPRYIKVCFITKPLPTNINIFDIVILEFSNQLSL